MKEIHLLAAPGVDLYTEIKKAVAAGDLPADATLGPRARGNGNWHARPQDTVIYGTVACRPYEAFWIVARKVMQYRLIIEDNGPDRTVGGLGSRIEALGAKREHLAFIKGRGFRFDAHTGHWRDDKGHVQDVFLEGADGSQVERGDIEDVKGIPPLYQMGITLTCRAVAVRPDALGMYFDEGTDHWAVSLTRNNVSYTLYMSVGKSWRRAPDLRMVMRVLVGDYVGPEVPFAEWLRQIDEEEPDTAYTRAAFALAQSNSAALDSLFPDFSLEDLHTITFEWTDGDPEPEPAPTVALLPKGDHPCYRYVESAAVALNARLQYWWNRGDHTPAENPVENLLADLMHYCDVQGLDFAAELERATTVYRDEADGAA